MTFDDPIWLETVRLIRKFFPESRGFINHPRELQVDTVFGILKMADPSIVRGHRDPSVDGSALYRWILDSAAMTPAGRAVVVPDCGCANRIPFICHVDRLLERADESVPEDCSDTGVLVTPEILFQNNSDALIVCESGEAIFVDHEDGVCWARTQARKNA